LAAVKHIFDDSQKERAIKLRGKLDAFKDRFDRDLIIEIQVKAAGEKKLDDLLHSVANPSLRNPCMEGTRNDILDKIESELKKVDGCNVIWIRGSPGVGKSALAASIAIRLQKQNRQVICFRFDRTESSAITADALWRVVARDLAHLYPSVCRHILEDNQKPISSDIDRTFEWLIERPLSTLGDVPREELPVIVIDALDECGGLRHDPSGRRDYEALLRTLRHWVEVTDSNKLKLVITSRPDENIDRILPESISTRVNIPSGADVKPGDSASNDIHAFLKSRLDTMGMEEAWVKEALDYLVPHAAGMFIWATTVADFLQENSARRLDILKTRSQDDGAEGFESLYSLYFTVVSTSFGSVLKQETEGITCVMGAMIFAKQPLNDDALMMFPGVESWNTLQFIRKGLASVIESGPILRFHHRSFEDYLLSPLFQRELPKLSAVQNRNLHERQLAVLCLNAMVSSKLHFNMCRLDSSSIRNVDIPPAVKSTISFQVSYSCQFWADHLVHTPSEDLLMEAVKFVMYEKLLFWMEVMSILGKAHEMFGILTQVLAWPGLKVCPQIVYCNLCLMLGGQTLDSDDELTSFIRDALRFISAFIVPISESAPHIYLSALPFSPERSLVADKFYSRFPNTLKVTQGRPVQWSMTIFTAEHHNNPVKFIVFSPDGKTFVSISIGAIYICDSETGHSISGPFESEDTYSYSYQPDACFSPDGRHVLVQYVEGAVVWDIERGKKQFEIRGYDSVYIHYGRYRGRIASIHQDWTGVRVKLWDAGNGVLMSNKLFKVTDAGITRLSPDGRFLAIGRKSGNVIELLNVEDGKIVRRFPYPSGNLSSLRFSPTSDSLVASFRFLNRICLWRLDTQEMASVSVYVGDIPPAVIHLPSTDHLFISRDDAVEIWDVSMTGSNMISKIESPMTPERTCICPSRDSHRLLVGSEDGSLSMWSLNAEDLAIDRPVAANTQDDTRVISLSCSGKIAVTISQSGRVEFRDTTTWEVIGRTDIEYEYHMNIAFSPDDNRVAFWSDSVITICDIIHLEKNRLSLKNRLSFKLLQSTRHIAFQTCNDLVMCAKLDNSDGILQVWHLTGFEFTFSLDIEIPKHSRICLAPDGLTVVIVSRDTVSCYSWNHDTAQFDPFHFTDEAHLAGFVYAYSPDGELFACQSRKDYNIRVWDARTGRLCSEPFTSDGVDTVALSPVLNDQSLSDRIIALVHSNTIRVYDVHTGNLYARLYAPENTISFTRMSFIQDGTKLALYSFKAMGIWDLRAEYSHAIHRYELILRDIKDGWMMDQDNAPLFWIPSEHRESLWVPLPRVVIKMLREMATGLDLSCSMLGSEWTECIDTGWLKALEEKEVTRKLLE